MSIICSEDVEAGGAFACCSSLKLKEHNFCGNPPQMALFVRANLQSREHQQQSTSLVLGSDAQIFKLIGDSLAEYLRKFLNRRHARA